MTLQRGNSHNGSGLYISTNGNALLEKNIITANTTGDRGGGIFIESANEVTLNDSIISNNSAQYGGGIESHTNIFILNRNVISNNTSSRDGGGIYNDGGSARLNDNTIEYNRGSRGGGFYGNAENFSNNYIMNNTAGRKGGGIFVLGNVTLNGNIVSDNLNNDDEGGGIYIETAGEASLYNNIIYNNLSGRGGGIFLNTSTLSSNVYLINNTIVSNTANDLGGGGIWIRTSSDSATAYIYNNIIQNNNASNINDMYIQNDGNNNYIASTINLYNNDFDQSAFGTYIQIHFPIDSSNLNNANPLFVDPDKDDYHLQAGSQCINAGDNSAPELPEIDKDGNPRVMDGIVDIGAYEYPGAALPIIDSFVAFPTSGEAPLPVTLTCVAHDFGGSIQTYTLDFGDGTSQNNATGVFNYEYVTTGTFDATCTAVDNDGESATSDPVTIAVTIHVNLPPVADCGQERAVVFNEITFDGTGSTDPDGTVDSYEWTLQHEDGFIITASGATPTISNLMRGFYDVTLKVYDNQSAFGTDTMLLAAAGSCSCTPSSIHFESITPTTIKGSKGRKFGQVNVFVADDCGNPVSSVEVTGSFSGDFIETVSGVTGADGSVTFTTSSKVKKPTYTFCVSSLANALPYESDDNVETCDELN